ncbi:extracellular GDSL-like lipase/acylhydrolase [Naematelia encephala]|uniref:Extracellular GDSL-like lipase/acylhydrolase n=1 Tax=Naematelia encephala TaxID=71784 RepID=A0A1Y2BJY2_9TREE|nr:extracellular GDSL-like lipase/acylhydrolase [Naematelia encephala]
MHDPASNHHWVSIWSTAAAPVSLLPDPAAQVLNFDSTTIRQTFRVTLGARRIRFILSNEYNGSNLVVSAMTVARSAPTKAGLTAGSPLIHEKTLHPVTLGRQTTQDIPPGSTALTDDISMELEPSTDITVSIYLASGQSGPAVTGHYDGKTDTWLQQGDATRVRELPDPVSVHHSFYVTGIEGWLPSDEAAIACFGDSITDRGDSNLPYNEYNGWIDVLSARLAHGSLPLSVLNLGISGDQVFAGGLARFDRDVLLQSGVKYVFVHMGVNDIGITPATAEAQDALYHRLVYAYRQIITKAHARGLVIIGSTIMPFLAPASWPTPWPFANVVREGTRERINAWITNEGEFDRVVDFSAAVTDPDHPNRIREKFQLCDFLHPSPEGYAAMAAAIKIEVFEPARLEINGG